MRGVRDADPLVRVRHEIGVERPPLLVAREAEQALEHVHACAEIGERTSGSDRVAAGDQPIAFGACGWRFEHAVATGIRRRVRGLPRVLLKVLGDGE